MLSTDPFTRRKPPRRTHLFDGLLGIRGFWDIGVTGKPIKVGTPVGIGTLPAGVMVLGASVVTSTLVAGTTTPTVDVGIRDFFGNATANGLVAAADVSAAGIVAGAGTKLGYQDVEQEVTVTLNGTGAPTGGRFNVIVQFAPNAT